MTTSIKLAGVLLLSCLALVPAADSVSAGDAPSVKVAPLKGIALTVGSKRAIGYYANAGKSCDLTLMLADAYSENAQPGMSQPVRVNLKIDAGTSARVETYESTALAFTCAADAASLTVRPEERVAYNTLSK